VKLLRLPFVLAVALAAMLGLLTTPASAVERTCLGNTGTFNSEGLLKVDWARNATECFGVAPSGTIWHTWEGAGRWYEMPGNGRALFIEGGYDVLNPDNLNAYIGKAVKVGTSSNNWYCSYLDYATNTWSSSWYEVNSYTNCSKYGGQALQWHL
jgi:hypothetical protein